MSAQQRVGNTEASANKNRPGGTDFFRKCQKTEAAVVQLVNLGGEGLDALPGVRVGEVRQSVRAVEIGRTATGEAEEVSAGCAMSR